MSATILSFRQKPTKHKADSSPEKHSGIVLIHFPIRREYDVNNVGGTFPDGPLPAA
jgi:hypothetical protein